MHAVVQKPNQPHFDADVLGKHHVVALSSVERVHNLMELTAQSIVIQEGGREHEEDSPTAEARLLVPLQLFATPSASKRLHSDVTLTGCCFGVMGYWALLMLRSCSKEMHCLSGALMLTASHAVKLNLIHKLPGKFELPGTGGAGCHLKHLCFT